MSTIDLHDFEHDPTAAIGRVEAGEHLVVCREGRPVVEMHPVGSPARRPRPFGLAAGAFSVPADFDDPLPEEMLREFEGR